MANKRLGDNTEIGTITGADFIPIISGTDDYNVEVDDLATYYTIPTMKANISTNTSSISALEAIVSTNTLDISSIQDNILPTTPNSVNSAKVNASGYADFIAKVDDTSVVHYAGGSNPNIVETDVLGRTHTITADETITGMTNNGTYEMLKEYDLATGVALASAPVAVLTTNVSEAQVLPSAGAGNDGKYITVIGIQPNRQYKGVSSAWVETTFISRGQVVVSAGAISSVSTYPYNQNNYDINMQNFYSVMNSYFSGSFSTSGWCKLPNGLIMQWGNFSFGNNLCSGTIYFNINFPSGALFVNPNTVTDGNFGTDIYLTGKNQAYFTWHRDAGTNVNLNAGTAYYFAIGY